MSPIFCFTYLYSLNHFWPSQTILSCFKFAFFFIHFYGKHLNSRSPPHDRVILSAQSSKKICLKFVLSFVGIYIKHTFYCALIMSDFLLRNFQTFNNGSGAGKRLCKQSNFCQRIFLKTVSDFSLFINFCLKESFHPSLSFSLEVFSDTSG